MSKKIMAYLDGSPFSEAVCDYAAWAGQRLRIGIHVLHVLERSASFAPQDLSGSLGMDSQESLLMQMAELDESHNKLALQRGRLLLEAAQERAKKAGIAEVTERLRNGTLVETMQELEEETRLLIMGKRGASSSEAHGHLGLHVEPVIRSVHKPILLTQQRFTEPKSVMLAYDGSATALKGLEMLAGSPLAKGLPVHLVMAGANVEAAQAQMKSAAAIMQNAGFDTTIAIVGGEPEKVLHDYQQQQQIELMVMGAYGHSRIRQFIVGSTTTAMMQHAKCSLLILR